MIYCGCPRIDASLKYPSIDKWKTCQKKKLEKYYGTLVSRSVQRITYHNLVYVGKDQPESCYQYLLIYFNNRKTFLHGTIRGGSAHSQNDFCGYLGLRLYCLQQTSQYRKCN